MKTFWYDKNTGKITEGGYESDWAGPLVYSLFGVGSAFVSFIICCCVFFVNPMIVGLIFLGIPGILLLIVFAKGARVLGGAALAWYVVGILCGVGLFLKMMVF